MESANDDLIANWWEYHRRANGSHADRKSLELGEPRAVLEAFASVEEMVSAGGPGVLGLLEQLNEAAPPGDEGRTVGAGPLEDLIHEHGDSVVPDVEERARRSPAFAQALSRVWLDAGRLDETTVGRLSNWLRSS